LVKKAKEKKTILPQLISQMKNLLAIKLGPLYLKLNYIIILLKMIKKGETKKQIGEPFMLKLFCNLPFINLLRALQMTYHPHCIPFA
jgi:hypothetical protein